MTDHDEPPFKPESEDSPADSLEDSLEESRSEPILPGRTESSPPIPWRLGVFLLLAVLVVVFAVQNTQDATLHFLGWSWSLPLVIIILATVVVSVILDEVLGAVIKRRQRRRHEEREELRRLRDMS